METPHHRILITGATGFIGSHLTRRLINDGFEVAIIKRNDPNPWRIADIFNKIKIYDTDLQDSDSVLRAFEGFKPDIVFHLAAFYAVNHQPREVPLMVGTNVSGTINLLEAASQFKPELFVNTSSCFVYKLTKSPLAENSQLDPLNLYAMTKIHAEQACSLYAKQYGLNAVTLRLFPPYGPFDHERRLIPYLIKNFLAGKSPKMTSGKQSWDYVYIDDVIESYLCVLKKLESFSGHEIFNIGSANPVSVKQIAQQLKKIMDTDTEPKWGATEHRKNEVWFICADINKAKKKLGWIPKTKLLEDGLQLTCEWFRNFWQKEESNES